MSAAKDKITNFFKPVSKEDVGKKEKERSNQGKKRKLEENDPSSAKVRTKVVKVSEELPVLSTTIGASWFEALQGEFTKPYFAALSAFVTKERAKGSVLPSPEEVWTWTTRTAIREVKVVILGQDPYPTPGNPHGLCFSVRAGVPHPASLKNIFKELESDVAGFVRPRHGHLGGWADQGVLLLNAVLTVRGGEANSHKGRGWERVTDAVIQWISTNCSDVVFLLWGGYAQKKAAKVDGSRHHVLTATHPSPLGANKGGWFGCRHFSRCNALLEAAGREPVDWSRLPEC